MKYSLAFTGMLSMLTLAACSPSVRENVDVDVNTDSSVNVTTNEGTYQTGNTLPEDWPKDAPVYAKGTILFTGTSNPATGKPGMAVTLSTEDAAKTVYDYFVAQLPKEGWAIDANVQTGSAYMVSATKDQRVLSVMISGGDQTSITMGLELPEQQ
jgi:hypothetical protein